MAPLQITCTGESTVQAPAERAIVFITISSEDTTQSSVSREVTKTANAVQSHLKTIAIKDTSGQPDPNAPITHWSMSTLSTGSWQPTDNEGKPLPRKFTASTKLEVTFRDFGELGTFTSNLAETEFVSIERIEWKLTAETKAALGRHCRRNAVKDAMMKAQDYADSAGKVDFEILEITDVGVSLGLHSGYTMHHAMYKGVSREQLNYEPETVEVRSEVRAKFDAA